MLEGVIIRRSEPSDSVAILELIKDLAAYEKCLDQVEISSEELSKKGYGPNAAFDCMVAQLEDEIIGMALFYPRFSTWKGSYIYLEDLIVKEKYRRKAIGKALLDSVIEAAKSRNAARLEWQVLDWNKPAIDFYRTYNAEFDNEWINVRLTRDNLESL